MHRQLVIALALASLCMVGAASPGATAGPLVEGEYVTVQDGHLSYQGKRLRLWGTNFTCNVKREGEDLELNFDRLVDAGFNGIRLNLFANTFASVPERTNSYDVPMSEAGVDTPMGRLDHAVYLAKERGMFFWFSFDRGGLAFLPEDYDILPDDGTREAWIDAASKAGTNYFPYIDARAEAIHHAFARNILEHMNPHTGKRYADEEAIAVYEIFNETLLVRELVFGGYWTRLPEFCRNEVTRRWNGWLRERYDTDEKLESAWGALGKGESLDKGTVAFAPLHQDVEAIDVPGGVKEFRSKDESIGAYPYARGEDVVRFACHLYQSYNQRFVAYVRSLGEPGKGISIVPIAPTGCYERNFASYYAASDGDFHAGGTYGFAFRPHESWEEGDPMYPWRARVNQHPFMGQPTDIVRMAGKPYLIYECNDYRPSPYRVEFPMRIVVKLLQQDADGAFFFNWDDSGYLPELHCDGDYVNTRLCMPDTNYPNAGLIQVNDEPMLAALRSAGTIFRHGNLPPPPNPVEARIGKDLLFNLAEPVMGSVEHHLRHYAWRDGLRLVYDPEGPTVLPAAPANSDPPIATQPHLRIVWGPRGTMRIDAPAVKAQAGFNGPEIAFGDDTTVTGLNRDFSFIGIVAEDGLPLAESRSILLTMASDATNEGYTLDPSRAEGGLTEALAKSITNAGGKKAVLRMAGTVTAPWLRGMSFEKRDFGRTCYARGNLFGSFTVTEDEPLFYARLARPAKRVIRKMLVVGNSLTNHGPSDAIGWNGQWGMAATARENDFAHVLHRKVCEAQPEPDVQLIVEGLLARDMPSRTEQFEGLSAYQADLIIIQIGDNLSEDDAGKDSLGKPYEELLSLLEGDHAPLIVGVGTWGEGPVRDRLIRRACMRRGALFVRIVHLSRDSVNRAESEGHFEHAGVNWHPGDRGMQAIADTLWAAIEPVLAGP
ncbi:MAG: beta-galactosidase [Candidatus Hydrogenedentes bacterium]|nr:beta-galactosidase [Candidatus Hydrogenedentota bacterium]